MAINSTSGVMSFNISWTPSAEIDVVGSLVAGVHESQLVNGDFTITSETIWNNGPETSIFHKTSQAGLHYYRIAFYDSFEDPTAINYSGLNWSALHSVEALSENMILPDTLFNELRTDFIVNSIRFFLGDSPYNSATVNTLHWDGGTTGSIIRGTSIYALTGTGSIVNANGQYIIATLSDVLPKSASLSILPMSAGTPTLGLNQIIVGVTSNTPPSVGSNNVAYIRQSNSAIFEGALIRNLQVSNNLAVGNNLIIGDAVLQFNAGQVRNADISVDSNGTLQGIGTGSGTAVKNDLLTSSINSAATTATVDVNGNLNGSGGVAVRNSDITLTTLGYTVPDYTSIGGAKPPVDADKTSTILGNTGTLTLNQALTINSLLTISGANAGISLGLTGMSDNANAGLYAAKDSLGNVRLKCGIGDITGGTGTPKGFAWDGSDFYVRGKLIADDIQANGTITACSLKTKSSTSAQRLEIDTTTDVFKFYESGASSPSVSIQASDSVTGNITVITSTGVGIRSVSDLAAGWFSTNGGAALILASSSTTSGAPLNIAPSSASAAPSHSTNANTGSFWVTSGGDLYFKKASGWVKLI